MTSMLNKQLLDYRIRHNMSQTQMADLLGIAQSTYAYWEKTPNLQIDPKHIPTLERLDITVSSRAIKGSRISGEELVSIRQAMRAEHARTGLSWRDLAIALGVTRGQLMGWLYSVMPPADILERLRAIPPATHPKRNVPQPISPQTTNAISHVLHLEEEGWKRATIVTLVGFPSYSVITKLLLGNIKYTDPKYVTRLERLIEWDREAKGWKDE